MPPEPAAPPERTLTALRSPFASQTARAPVLLLCARTSPWDRSAVFDGSRIVSLDRTVELGRRTSRSDTHSAITLDDPLVSSHHARLEVDAGAVTLLDLGSKNGTFVDGVRIEAPAAIADGSRIFVGSHIFVLRYASTEELAAMRAELAAPLAPVPSVSPRLATLCARLRKLARTDAELFLVGETGVGKEVYARAVHTVSGRSGRFVSLNCAALPRDLVESELFGFYPGAHSTAQTRKKGLLEEAEGGTLFLDEIGEMNPEVQVKLLRFLQDRELTPLGSTRSRKIDVRFIAATNRQVAPGLRDGLRDDLLARLGAAPVVLTPLRERIEDLGALAWHFLSAAPAAGFDGAAWRALSLYGWPLNVRELEKIVRAACALGEPERPLGLADLPERLSSPVADAASSQCRPAGALSVTSGGSGRKPPEPAPSAAQLDALLRAHHGNVADVSRALGRQRAAVWRWIKRFGLGPERYR